MEMIVVEVIETSKPLKLTMKDLTKTMYKSLHNRPTVATDNMVTPEVTDMPTNNNSSLRYFNIYSMQLCRRIKCKHEMILVSGD